MFTVYILLSEKDQKTYIGYTKDIKVRLQDHNSGRVTATRHRTPFRVFLTEEFQTIREAKERELWWKSSSGRRKLKEIFRKQSG